MDNIYTKNDLAIMQKWPLSRKIQVTQHKIIEWYYHYNGKVAVSFSGGKDSTVLLDLVRRAFPDVPAVFVDTGLEYPEIRAFVKATSNVIWLQPKVPFYKVIEQYGYPVISKDISRVIYYARKESDWALKALRGLFKNGNESIFNKRFIKWAFLVNAPFNISDKCCEIMKKRPYRIFSKESGRVSFIGTMASESSRRELTYLKNGCNAFDKKQPTSQPLSFWTQQDILAYLKLTKIPYADVYGDIITHNKKLITTGVERTGCMFCMFGIQVEKTPNRFQMMERTHPKQFNYCINTLGCGTVLDYLNIPYCN